MTTMTRPTSLRKIGAASFIGTTIEWYDFFIYSTAAALVFNRLFFPGFDPLIGTALSFMTFAAGFLARPLGAILLGHFGDRIGRKSTLIVTLVAMGVSTALIGCLPTFNQIGIWAPILLVTLRIVQGLAVGGEWGGAVLIAAENAPPNKKTLYGAFAQMGSPGGLVLASVVFTIVQASFNSQALEDFAWRIPFLISAIFIPIGLVIRLRIDDAPEFKEAHRRQQTNKVPFIEVFRRHSKRLAIGTAAFTGVFLIYYLLTSFVLTYATTTLGMTRAAVLPANIIAAVVEGIFIAVGVFLAKKFTARLIAAWSAIGLAVWSIPAFALMHTAEPALLYVAVGGTMVFVGTSYGVLAGEVVELFIPTVRYTGASLCYHLAGAIGGGLGPVLATSLLSQFQSSVPIVILCIIVAGFMYWACMALPKRQGEILLAASESAVPEKLGTR